VGSYIEIRVVKHNQKLGKETYQIMQSYINSWYAIVLLEEVSILRSAAHITAYLLAGYLLL